MTTGHRVDVRLLGGFDLHIDGRRVPPGGWPSRRAAELVQLLALAQGRRLHREQVVDTLWPHLSAQAGAANLRKAAHLARQALLDPEAVVLRGGQVALFPGRDVCTDVSAFDAQAARALRSGDAGERARAAAGYTGELLPGARYEAWAAQERDRLRGQYLDLLRASGSWEQVADTEPTDEQACCALMRTALAAGDRPSALRRYGWLRAALGELGLQPGREAQQLYDRCVEGLGPPLPALVGRDVELARIDAALRRAAGGQLRALVVRGPAGIGKTALCGSAAAAAARRGWLVVTVGLGADPAPYAPLALAVEQLVRREPRLLESLPERARRVLAALTPAVVAPPLGEPVTRHQVLGAVRRLLLAAGGGSPVLVVVDDVHLADGDGAAALLHLASSDSSGVVLVVLVHRPAPDREPLLAGVSRLERAGAVVTVDLAPLPPAEAAELVALASPRRPAAEGVARVVDLAAGNPFFLLELAHLLRPDGRAVAASSAWESVTRRFVDVDAATLQLLRRLAVLGDELSSATVVALAGGGEDDVFALLDRALTAGVLEATATGFVFAHALVREALLRQVPPHRRAVLHADAASRLAASGGSPEAVARHWMAGEQPAAAAPFLEAAARRAIGLGAFTDALLHLDELLRHAPASWTALYLRAEAMEAVGDARAPTAFAAAALAAPEHERDDVRARQALASVRAGDPAAAVLALEGVEARSLQGRLSQALALAGAVAMGVADPGPGVTRAHETRRLAIASGDPSAVVIASWAEAAAAHAAGELPDLIRAGLRETYALPDLAITTFDGHLCVAERLLYGNRPYEEVVGFADALEAEAVQRGAARGQAFATTLRGEALLLSGHLDRAAVDLTRGSELHRAISAAGGQALSLQRLAEVSLQLGERRGAEAFVDQALTVARDSALGFHLFDRIYGTRIAAADDPVAALAAVEEAEEVVHGSMETCPGCRITLVVPAAIASAQAGDLDRACRYEATAERLTTLLMRLPGWYAALEEVRGHRAAAQGDHGAARRHLGGAAERFAQAGQPVDRDRCARAATVVGNRG
jgi:DNA-binding SARP family transcriptional activator/tetratricopeptide (TPR) repeat protein